MIKSIAYRRRRIKFVFSSDGLSCGTVTFWDRWESGFTAKALRSQSETQCGVEPNPVFATASPLELSELCALAVSLGRLSGILEAGCLFAK